MKKIAPLVLVLFCSFKCFSQNPQLVDSSKLEILPVDSVTNQIDFQEVIKVDGVSKNELYQRALKWFEDLVKNGIATFDKGDIESGKLTGGGMAKGHTGRGITKVDFTIKFTIELTIKDGRYRYEMTNFFGHVDGGYKPFDITKWYLDPKQRKSSGEFRNGTDGYIHYSSFAGQFFSNTLKLTMNGTLKEQPNPKDNF